VGFIVTDDIKSPCKHSLRLNWYQADRTAEEGIKITRTRHYFKLYVSFAFFYLSIRHALYSSGLKVM